MACFDKNFDNDYTKLVSQIKSQGKKKAFFFYKEYQLYLTEYLVGDGTYVYVCKGFCKSKDDQRLNSLFISNQSVKE